MEVSARAATTVELPVLVELIEAGIEAVADQRGAELWRLEHAPRPPWAASLGRRLADGAAEVALAGCIDDAPVGVLLADRRPLVDGRRLARISFVFVDPRARGIGVGESLIDAASAWAVGAGCVGIDGLALPGDRETKNLYERAGMSAREITVYRSLGGP